MQLLQLGEFILVLLVSMCGCSATPAYYNVIAGAISWAHNGGVAKEIIESWAAVQEMVTQELPGASRPVGIWLAYGPSSES